MPGTRARSSCEIEVRIDPLTGSVSRINKSRSSRPRQSVPLQPPAPHSDCPFCPQNLEQSTPRFPPEFCSEGRISAGGAVAFPNMFPLASFHGVVVFTPEHKLEIQGFSPREISDGILASIEFIRLASRCGAPYHLLGWNHLNEAGASMLHPHFQVIADDRPTRSLAQCLECSRGYLAREGKSYWRDLLECEKASPRFLGRTEGFLWLSPWAPLGSCEVMGVSEDGTSSLLMLEEGDVCGMAEGICRVLKGMWGLGKRAVSMAVYSLPVGDEAFSLHVRLMARSQKVGCDRAFLEVYGGEVGTAEPPEEYSKAIRDFF